MSTQLVQRESGAVARVDNPFASAPVVAQPVSAGIAAVNARELAEIHGQMQIARMNPRSPVKAMDQILNAFARPSLAEKGMYEYSRGGQEVTGLSIRSAEAIAQCWGNIRAGIKEQSRSNGQSEVQAYAWDLETGYYEERTFHVKHWRDTKKGGYQITEERDISELMLNLGQRRKRACILALLPSDVKEAAERQIQTTMKANIQVTPETIQAMVKYFEEEFDVTKAMIEARIQRRIDSIVPAQMLQLKRIVQSLKDGMGTPADFFDLSIGNENAGANTGTGGSAGAGNDGAASSTASSAQTTQTQSVKDKLKGKQTGAGNTSSLKYTKESAIQVLKEAGSSVDLEKAWVDIGLDHKQTNREIDPDIEDLYKARKEELNKL